MFATEPFIALFVIGGSLLQFRISQAGPQVAAITFAKLVVHPLIIGAGFALIFGWENPITRDALLFASMPIFLSYAVFATKYKADEIAASAVMLSTLLGAITVTLLLSFQF